MQFDETQERIFLGIQDMLLEEFKVKYSIPQIRKLIEHSSWFYKESIECQQIAPIAYIGKFKLIPELMINRYDKKNIQFIENSTYHLIKDKENANTNRRTKIYNLRIERGAYD